ncbi:ATP-binding protein [Archangium sp.]|uniref:ATP-binding protein n=1 Tax=Archangium sp. TaxID=1872627 RepID=UPI00286D2216|nr:ATP-binding protein [Archangium sp.]
MTNGDDLMTASDAGHLLGLSADMVRTLHRLGRLPALRTLRGHRLFRRADVEQLAEARARGAFHLPEELDEAARLDGTGLLDEARPPPSAEARLFAGGGELGTLMAALDWARTPLGPVEGWPQSLRTAVSLCVTSRAPMALWWGPEYVLLYNDAYRPMLGARHPWALGRLCQEVWAEAAAVLLPQLDAVRAGGPSTWEVDAPFILERSGSPEEAYFTYGFSPVLDESGAVGGICNIPTETTERVLEARRLRTLTELSATRVGQATAEEVCREAARILGRNPHDVPFCLVYLLEEGGHRALLAAASGLTPGQPAAPREVLSSQDAPGPWPLAAVLAGGEGVRVDGLEKSLGVLPGGPWPEGASSAWLLPLVPGDSTQRPVGVLVCGLSPRLALCEAYKGFLGLVAASLARGVRAAQAQGERERFREAAEQARAEAEAERRQLHSLFMQAPVAISLYRGPQYVIELANPLMCDILGREFEQMRGTPLVQALPEIVAQGIIERSVTPVFRTGTPFVGTELPLQLDRRGDGTLEQCFFNFVHVPLRAPDGTIEGVVAVASDVTEGVRARQQVELSEERLRLSTEAAGVGIWELDQRTLTAWRSEQHDKAFGYETRLPEWSFDLFLAHVHPEDRERVRKGMTQAMETQGSFELEFQVVWPDESLHWMAATGSVRTDASGRPTKMVGLNLDISTRKKTEQELERAIRSRDEFLSVASHELKTPMTSLALRLAQLKREARGGPDQRPREREVRNLEVAERQLKKLGALMDDLLDVSRLATGRMRFEPEPLDLSALVREVASRFEPDAARAGCALEARDEGPVIGNWDRLRVEQVVTNLLSNALKYGAGRPVHITVESGGHRARLVVRDEGIGIAPEALGRIFEKFERAVSERHYGGLGLGLYLTRRIVEAMGGTVRVESTQGQGATFTVELPLAPG